MPAKCPQAFEQYNYIYFFTRFLRIFIMRKIIASLFLITGLFASTLSFAGPKVEFKTTMGNFVVELDSVKAPKTTANFLNYVNSGFYNGTIFHRVIDGFMIQGGGFDTTMKQKESMAEIKNEADNGLKNDKYTIAMARTSAPHSASSQFFINAGDNDFLNHSAPTSSGWGYCVFGKVVAGMDVVDKIRQVATGNSKGHQDVPVDNVVIETSTRA